MTVARSSSSLTGVGGLELFWQSWLGEDRANAVVVIVHGAGEHSDRYDWTASRLADAGYAVYALDHRGHGRSQGARAVIDRVDHAVSDLHRLVVLASAAHPDAPAFMLAHSLGAMIALRYALSHQNQLDGLILSGALARIEAPAPLRLAGRLISVVAPSTPLIALDPELVSRDPAVVAAYRADPLVHHGRVPARTAAEIADTTDAFPTTVGAITIPTLILYGTADGLCPPAGSVMLADRLGAQEITVRAYEGLYHELLNEPERETVLADVLAWLASTGSQLAAARRPPRAPAAEPDHL